MTPSEIISFNEDLKTLEANFSLDHATIHSINKETKHLASSYRSLSNKYLPQREITKKEKKSLLKPWITRGIRVSIKVRDKLLRKSTHTKCDRMYKEYKYYRNLITRLKKK